MFLPNPLYPKFGFSEKLMWNNYRREERNSGISFILLEETSIILISIQLERSGKEVSSF